MTPNVASRRLRPVRERRELGQERHAREVDLDHALGPSRSSSSSSGPLARELLAPWGVIHILLVLAVVVILGQLPQRKKVRLDEYRPQAGAAPAASAFATCASAQITFYENETFTGPLLHHAEAGAGSQPPRVQRPRLLRSSVAKRPMGSLRRTRRFGGRCMILRPGRYPSLPGDGPERPCISSVRTVDPSKRTPRARFMRYSPAPVATYNYHQRSDERLPTTPT